MRDGDSPVAEHRIRVHAELPQRRAELLLTRAQRSWLSRGCPNVGQVQVPPPGPVREHVQAAVVPPDRGQHRFGVAAHDHPAGARLHHRASARVAQRGHLQFRPVPGHPRVVPADPGQGGAVRRGSRVGVEVRPADQDPDRVGGIRGRAVQRDGDDRASDPPAGVPFPDAPDLAPVGGDREVGKPVGGTRPDLDRRRGQRPWHSLAGLPARVPVSAVVQPLVREVREDHATGHRQVRLAAVLVYAGPRVVRHREQVTGNSVRPLGDQGQPPALGGPGLDPPRAPTRDRRKGQPDMLAGDVRAGDRRGPFAVTCRFRSHLHTDMMPDPAAKVTWVFWARPAP